MLRRLVVLVSVLLVSLVGTAHAQSERPVVRAVLFWADGCPHCHLILDEVLPPLRAQYGEQLDVQLIEISGDQAYQYFRQIEDRYRVPSDLKGVPALFVGDRLLVGSEQIPGLLPGLIRQYLAAGGVGYPALEGLGQYLAADAPRDGLCAGDACLQQVSFGAAAAAGAGAGPLPAQMASNGFTLAIVIMVLMALALVYVLFVTARASMGVVLASPGWAENLIPVLAVIGLGVAGYLTFVETQNVAAVCGPVGDCNAVQSSPYARLFGILPVGLLGAAGYVGILLAWLAARFGEGRLVQYARLALFAMALFGVLFSLYLTYLEPFVIRAVCMWCLANAVIITLIMLFSTGSATDALAPAEEFEA